MAVGKRRIEQKNRLTADEETPAEETEEIEFDRTKKILKARRRNDRPVNNRVSLIKKEEKKEEFTEDQKRKGLNQSFIESINRAYERDNTYNFTEIFRQYEKYQESIKLPNKESQVNQAQQTAQTGKIAQTSQFGLFGMGKPVQTEPASYPEKINPSELSEIFKTDLRRQEPAQFILKHHQMPSTGNTTQTNPLESTNRKVVNPFTNSTVSIVKEDKSEKEDKSDRLGNLDRLLDRMNKSVKEDTPASPNKSDKSSTSGLFTGLDSTENSKLASESVSGSNSSFTGEFKPFTIQKPITAETAPTEKESKLNSNQFKPFTTDLLKPNTITDKEKSVKEEKEEIKKKSLKEDNEEIKDKTEAQVKDDKEEITSDKSVKKGVVSESKEDKKDKESKSDKTKLTEETKPTSPVKERKHAKDSKESKSVTKEEAKEEVKPTEEAKSEKPVKESKEETIKQDNSTASADSSRRIDSSDILFSGSGKLFIRKTKRFEPVGFHRVIIHTVDNEKYISIYNKENEVISVSVNRSAVRSEPGSKELAFVDPATALLYKVKLATIKDTNSLRTACGKREGRNRRSKERDEREQEK